MPKDEIDTLKISYLKELDYSASLKLLTSIEASFRIDFGERVYTRKRDPFSRALRELHKTKGNKASLEDDIFETWKMHTDYGRIISELKGAFKFRHWLAHGRYWTPKLGRSYDYFDVATIAQLVDNQLGLLTPK